MTLYNSASHAHGAVNVYRDTLSDTLRAQVLDDDMGVAVDTDRLFGNGQP